VWKGPWEDRDGEKIFSKYGIPDLAPEVEKGMTIMNKSVVVGQLSIALFGHSYTWFVTRIHQVRGAPQDGAVPASCACCAQHVYERGRCWMQSHRCIACHNGQGGLFGWKLETQPWPLLATGRCKPCCGVRTLCWAVLGRRAELCCAVTADAWPAAIRGALHLVRQRAAQQAAAHARSHAVPRPARVLQ
jgi:hypothetical protein